MKRLAMWMLISIVLLNLTACVASRQYAKINFLTVEMENETKQYKK